MLFLGRTNNNNNNNNVDSTFRASARPWASRGRWEGERAERKRDNEKEREVFFWSFVAFFYFGFIFGAAVT